MGLVILFIDCYYQRIDRIRSTLSSDLDHLFSTTLVALVEGKDIGKGPRATEADKARWIGDITECLKIYDVLGLWGDAEEVIRTDVVREFVKKVTQLSSTSAYDDTAVSDAFAVHLSWSTRCTTQPYCPPYTVRCRHAPICRRAANSNVSPANALHSFLCLRV